MSNKGKNSAPARPETSQLDEQLIALAQAGDLKGFVEAMLAHPVHGPLMRAFALEEAAPEYEETMRRIRERFGIPEAISGGRD